MDKKRVLASAVVFLILAALFYLQYRHWRTFDWGTFWSQTHRIKKIHVLHGIALIYLGYVMRAWRWKIFLKPVRPKARTLDMVSPTLVGFTGLALLGRAGEFIRPYLIARRTDLPVSSQVAVWGVERIFDIGAFTVLMLLAIFLPSALPSIPHPEYYLRFRELGFGLTAAVAVTTIMAVVIRRNGERVAVWVEGRFSHLSSHVGPRNVGHKLAQKVREFGLGLNTIDGPLSFISLTLVSVGMWYVIALAYQEVTHSYGVDALAIPVSQLLIVMFASMLGSMLQLPAVGGGSQMATIATLSSVFDVPAELAASCGILLWLVTFAAVVPLGLILAHHERLSLRKLSAESHAAEEAEMERPPVT
ncbi:MAG TPA: lysylphosphatidylglycerol synthase transmembrane domain-containing protein [Terriglobales bacterium]|nr:lysylphosphatidylglycerol synthase transmembrane domain-containing protein [Terriglobales bacterium]